VLAADLKTAKKMFLVILRLDLSLNEWFIDALSHHIGDLMQ
jgi:hypothetical protein